MLYVGILRTWSFMAYLTPTSGVLILYSSESYWAVFYRLALFTILYKELDRGSNSSEAVKTPLCVSIHMKATSNISLW